MQQSAGVLVYRRAGSGPEFLLGRHGGPYWANKTNGAWTIPKGLVEGPENPKDAALREFAEETGLVLDVALTPLEPVQTSAKRLLIWLACADLDLADFKSSPFDLEWPPRSGRIVSFPELDRIAYHGLEAALSLIAKGQRPVLAQAMERL